MKTFITVLLAAVLAMSLSVSEAMQGHEMDADQHAQMMSMMGDLAARSMMMDMVAEDPDMRHEMMKKMMQSNEMDMQKMMANPEMRARMLKHAEMMTAMMGSEGMDQAKMKEMMEDPEMMEMLKMHMMSAQMMGGMQGLHSEKGSMDHSH